MDENDESKEQSPTAIGVQHEIPIEEPKILNFNVLDSQERSIDDGDFFIRPQKKHGEKGYSYVVQFVDSLEQVHCYILDGETDSYGWCRCSTFGAKQICPHLYAAHRWKRGVLSAENQQIAKAAVKKLNGEETDLHEDDE